MASIEEEEITDVDGSVRKRRVVEADIIRITHADGKEEELKDLPADFRAKEDPWTPQGEPIQWELLKFPFGSIEVKLDILRGQWSMPSLITLLNENREILLNLGTISVLMLRSADAEIVLVGEEIPQH